MKHVKAMNNQNDVLIITAADGMNIWNGVSVSLLHDLNSNGFLRISYFDRSNSNHNKKSILNIQVNSTWLHSQNES